MYAKPSKYKASALWFRLRTVLSNYPMLYQRYCQLRYPRHAFTADTELLLEGYCRSGISFLAEAFLWAQEKQVNVSWNNHAPAGVKLAVKLSKPVVISIRQPTEVAVSQYIKRPDLSFEDILRGFIRYYRCLEPYKGACVVVTIEQIRADIGTIIGQVNQKYATSFTLFEHTSENEKAVYEVMKGKIKAEKTNMGGKEHDTGFPTQSRLSKRPPLEEAIRSPEFESIVQEAEEAYRRFLS